MMKNTLRNAMILCLSLVMLFSLSLTCFAAEESEYVPVEWEMDDTAENLWGNGKHYTRYFVNGAFYSDSETKFYFMDQIEFNDFECPVYGESAYPHIVNVSKSDGYSFVFVDAMGKQILDSFLDGTDCTYYLEEIDSLYTVVDDEFVQTLDKQYHSAGSKLTEIGVASLSEGTIYELTGHDSTRSKAYQHGAVYITPDGSTYYLCFEELPNTYFDADGFFSYRKGNVDVLKLEGDALDAVTEAIDRMEYKDVNNLFEASVVNGYYDVNGNPIGDGFDFGIDDSDYENFSIAVFWIFFILLGFVVPLAVWVLGILFPRIKKMGCDKNWYWLAVIAAVWMLSAGGILLTLL